MNKSGFDVGFIEKLKQNSDIVSVISKYIPLTRKGSQYWACCPFHYEKTPSFAIDEQGQFFHCFGCHESGDVISFVQKYENVDFLKAVEILSADAKMEMPERVFDENVSKQKKLKEQIFEINKACAKFYVNALYSEKGKNALDYLTSRNISKQSLMRFGIGFSPDWTSLIHHLKGQGFSNEQLIEAGVAESKNGRLFDPFCERIMFPILDSFGQVVGFSGRTMRKEKNVAKYRNTKETLVFKKSKSIFGINLIKKYKQENPLEKIIIAEGQVDVIKIHQAGLKFAVACMGTALTKDHAKQLKRFCDKVVVCFDGDFAGQKATLASLDILCDEGLNVSVVTLPDGKDPDEFIAAFGAEKFEEQINLAKPVVDFKIHFLSKKYNLQNNYEKTKFIKEALEVLKKQESLIDAEIYLKTLHELTGVSYDLLRQQLSIGPATIKSNLKPLASQENGYSTACKFVLASLLHKKSFAKIIDDENFYFLNPDLSKLFEEIKKGANVSRIFDLFDLEENTSVKEIVDYSFDKPNNEQFFNDSVKHIIKQNLQKKLDEINSELKVCDNSQKLEKLKQIKEISQKIISINGGNNG